MGFFNSGVVEILNIHSFGPIKSCGVRTQFSQAYTLRKGYRTLVRGSYRPRYVIRNQCNRIQNF